MYEDDLALTNRYGQGKRVENPNGKILYGEVFLNSKVIGEFVCDYTEKYESVESKIKGCIEYQVTLQKLCEEMNMSINKFCSYGNGKTLYGWHISDLVIYDKPKELETFTTFCCTNEKCCANCKYYLFDKDDLNGYRRWCDVCHRKPLTRPPQSWCYVEDFIERGE